MNRFLKIANCLRYAASEMFETPRLNPLLIVYRYSVPISSINLCIVLSNIIRITVNKDVCRVVWYLPGTYVL